MPALEYLLEAAQIYEDGGDQAGAATAFAGVGTVPASARRERRRRGLDAARARSRRARQKLATLEINIYNSLGSALISANRIDEAARYLATGIELAQATDNRNLLTKLLHNQSLLAKQRGDELAAPSGARRRQEYARDSRK